MQESKGLTLVKRFEGYSSTAYKCPAGVWTIGYGTTRYLDCTRVHKGDSFTKLEAKVHLAHEFNRARWQVINLVNVPLTLNQLDALASFVYNLGAGAFRASTLRKRINDLDFDDVPYQFSRWVYAGGRKLKGLVLRRQAEVNLWLCDDYG